MQPDQIQVTELPHAKPKDSYLKAITINALGSENGGSRSLPCGHTWIWDCGLFGFNDIRDGTVYIVTTGEQRWSIPFVLERFQCYRDSNPFQPSASTIVSEIVAEVTKIIEKLEATLPMHGEHDYVRPKVVSVDLIHGPAGNVKRHIHRLTNRIFCVDYKNPSIESFDPDQ